MSFKPPTRHDDQDKIRSDTAHDVRIGGNAKVSIGGMRQVAVKVTATGRDGISGTDAKGRIYHFLWAHVIGPTRDAPDDLAASAAPDAGQPMQKSLTTLRGHIAAYTRSGER